MGQSESNRKGQIHAVKAGVRLWEVIQVEIMTDTEKRLKQLRERSEEAQARAKRLVMEAKLLKRNRTA